MERSTWVTGLLIFVFLAAVVWWSKAPPPPNKVAAVVAAQKTVQTPAAADAEAPVTAPPILDDGSFNPLPTERIPFETKLETTKLREWRRTMPQRPATPAGQAPAKRYLVYPFLDRTRSGIGDSFTYAWHPLGMGALGAWTNADLYPVANYEFLRWGDVASSQVAEASLLQDLAGSIKANPALTGVERVVTGVYGDGQADNSVRLRVYLLSPSEGKPPVLLAESGELADRDFAALAANQRDTAREMVRKLVELQETGAAQTAISDADLAKALAQTANLLAISDLYAIEEGIDSALALARLAPENPAPLQAAAQGYMQPFTMMDRSWTNLTHRDYCLRGYALSQLALTYKQGGALAKLDFVVFCRLLGHYIDESAAGPLDETPKPLLGTWTFAAWYCGELGSSVTDAVPDWQRLSLESRQSWFVGSSQHRAFFEQCAAANKNRDLFNFLLYTKAFDANYRPHGANIDFDAQVRVSHAMAFTMMREEAALTLCLLFEDPLLEPQGNKLAADLAVLTQANAAELVRLADAGDYYGLCGAMEAGTSAWGTETVGSACRWGMLEDPACGYYKCARLIHEVEPVVRSASAARACPAGIAGLSFPAWERWKLANRLQCTGPALFCSFTDNTFGDRRLTNLVARNYFDADPDDAPMAWEVAMLLRSALVDADAIASARSMFRQALTGFPLSSGALYQTGRLQYFLGDGEKGYDLFRQSLRSDPFNDSIWHDLAEAFSRYKQFGRAIACYSRFLESAPKRWDDRIARNNLLIALKKPSPDTEEVYQQAMAALPGNPTFRWGYADYLIDTKKDLAAAWNLMLSVPPDAATQAYFTSTKFRILTAQGRTSEALAFVDAMPFHSSEGLALASEYASRGWYYMKLGNLAKAQQAVENGWKHGPMKGDVMVTMAEVMAKQGKYGDAIGMMDSYEGRYGQSLGTVLILVKAECLDNLNRGNDAFALLERESVHGDPALLAPLAKRYLASNQGAKVKDLVEGAYRRPNRTTEGIGELLDVYAQVDPAAAAARKEGLTAFFEGPPLTPDMR